MRKRLIGKAFAIAMSGAMVLTATPVTANIFNVAHIVKAADEQSDEYVYCYVGLTWAEYWANEGVYNANDTSSSDVEDSHYEKDKGGYDVVTRATTNHGLHRGSFQGNAVIEAKASDGTTKEFSVSHWSKDGKKFYQSSTDATGVSYAKGTITDTDGTQYKLTSYEVKGTKYVPVKVKTTDLDALKANHTVVENGGTLVGGYGENQLKSYQKTANVTANTYGLKTATKQEDGSFIFSARSNEGTESGVKDEALKEATGVTPNLRSGDAVGSYGETLRLDLNGDYGDLGANLQSVKWTFYGDDSTYTTPVKTYGTKFAADNWMHKSMGIQLGLTESARFDLSGDEAVGYWSVTVSALGYKDYTYKFHADKENIAQHVVIASDSDEVKALQSTIKTAEGSCSIVLIPPRFFSRSAISLKSFATSFFGKRSKVPSSFICSRLLSLAILFFIVLKFVSIPPGQRAFTKYMPDLRASSLIASAACFFVPTNKTVPPSAERSRTNI